jgi:hypothetical protein
MLVYPYFAFAFFIKADVVFVNVVEINTVLFQYLVASKNATEDVESLLGSEWSQVRKSVGYMFDDNEDILGVAAHAWGLFGKDVVDGD